MEWADRQAWMSNKHCRDGQPTRPIVISCIGVCTVILNALRTVICHSAHQATFLCVIVLICMVYDAERYMWLV